MATNVTLGLANDPERALDVMIDPMSWPAAGVDTTGAKKNGKV